ncbi:hypothetical protein ANN_07405 [Periplaneta americana]|uniref:Uncharacterized protein n=1 Tax=Periplaneta americana TaxID=6978 RepID=A0ABQ8SYI6_PERAM|nr:hypothetical protein ANN_07405 [Periplaneta americana]
MSPGSSTESYPAFARIGLRENPRKKPQPEDEYWRRDALMEEEIKRVVINIGIVCSDEECDEDEMDYDRPGGSTDTAVQLIVQIKLRPLPRGYSYFWNKPKDGPIEKNRRVQGLVIVLARGRRHVKKLSVQETSEQQQRNYHLPETIPQPSIG